MQTVGGGQSDFIIKACSLVKTYRKGKDHVVRALDGVDLTVRRGEFVAIVGPSGSGKSTLLHILGLLDEPDSGSMWLAGEDVAFIPPKVMAKLRNRKIGFVFQRHYLIPTLTALENVMLPLRYRRLPKPEARHQAEAVLVKVGLADRLRHRPSELSGGQQQRVAVARALVTGADLILADEPTGQLDSWTGGELMSLMRRINEEHGRTFVIVTHNPAVAAACDRKVTLRDGRIVEDVRS